MHPVVVAQAIRRAGLERVPLAPDRETVVIMHPDLVHEAVGTTGLAVQRGIFARVCPRYVMPLYAEREETPLTRSSLLLHQYRAGVTDIMNRVGAVTLVDPKSGVRFLMPGKQMMSQTATAPASPAASLTPPSPLEPTQGTSK